jgi:hypothetical protein
MTQNRIARGVGIALWTILIAALATSARDWFERGMYFALLVAGWYGLATVPE